MSQIKEKDDGRGWLLPKFKDLLRRGNRGREDGGLPENYTGRLNEAQGHDVEIVED